MRSPAELSEAFRAKGLKVTPQRQLLFRLLHDTLEHPSAEVLYAQASSAMPGISLRTVYQTLNDLVGMDELHVVNVGGSARFDPNTADHQHTICVDCGALRDVMVPGVDQLAVETLAGFHPQRTRVVVSGQCHSCRGALDPHPSNPNLSNPHPSTQGAHHP